MAQFSNLEQLSNGCICCTINDGLVDAVYKVLEKSDRIDYLVIETTGISKTIDNVGFRCRSEVVLSSNVTSGMRYPSCISPKFA